MTTTITHARRPNSPGVKFFGGLVAGLTTAMVTSSLLYLLWFIALGRPGSHLPTVDEIIPTIRRADETRSADELHQAAESVRVGKESSAKFYYTLEILILTSTCLVAAYFAALYGRMHDEGDGRAAGGTLLLPTLIGTAVGAVVLWFLFSSLVAKPLAAHPPAHGAAGHTPTASHPPAAVAADHGSTPPVSPPRAEATHDDHGPKDWSAWLAENSNIAELIAYVLGTLAAAAVGVLAPRGGGRATAAPAAHSYQPAH